MKQKIASLQRIFKEYPEIWFFLFASLIFVVMYVWTLSINPRLRTPLWLFIFTFLMFVHVISHWVLFVLEKRPKYNWVYIVGQGLLAFIITLISQNFVMILCLYMALVGEVLGILKKKLWISISFIYFLILGLINYALIFGVDGFSWNILGVLPILLFVVIYVTLLNRIVESREKARGLLVELEDANQQLSAYANQVEELTLNNERQRMARELHDTLAQGLAGLILQLEAADSYLSSGQSEKSQAIIQQAMKRARYTLSDARDVIGDLRETPSTTNELVEAVKNEVERFTNLTGIPCEMKNNNLGMLPGEISENLLRAVSEGLLNIAKHAQATAVSVQVTRNLNLIYLTISDDGVGFDPKMTIGSSSHYGLLGIRERTRNLGGQFEVDSMIDKGSKILLEIPINQSSTIEGQLDNGIISG